MGAESLWEPHTPVRSPPPPPSPPASPPPPPPASPAPATRRRYRRPFAVAAVALVMLVGGGLGFMYMASERLGDNVTRVQNAFDGLNEADRPPATAALTFLLVGTVSRT